MREIIIDSWPMFTFLSTILMVWLQAKGLWMIILCNKINIVTVASISNNVLIFFCLQIYQGTLRKIFPVTGFNKKSFTAV